MPRKRAKPNCYIIAGSNGAGKTTFATRFLPRYAQCINFINPDLLARGLSPFDPNAGLLRAGRLVSERITEMREGRADFAFETTLSGRHYIRVINDLRADGYRVHMFYLWIPSLQLALLRVRERVEKGGHNVPAPDVRRRFRRTLHNLLHLYRPLLDTLRIFDNSTEAPALIFEDQSGQTTIYDAALYRQVMAETTL